MLTIYIAILKFSRLNQHSFHLALVHNFCIHLGVTYHCFIQQWFHSLDYFKPLLHTYQTFMNERVIIQVGAVPQDQLPWLVPSHMIPQDTYFYCDFELDVSSLVLVWRLVFIHQHQGCYKFSRHYVYTWQGYRQFIWRLVDYSFTPDAISKTKGLTPIFFFSFSCSGFYTTDDMSWWFALQLIDRLWSHWGFLAYHSFSPYSMLIQATQVIYWSSSYKSILWGISSEGWGAFIFNEMDDDPASRLQSSSYYAFE